MHRLDKALRENQLIETFLSLAAKEGVEAVTLQKVADAAGVSFATVQSYFGGGAKKLAQKAVVFVGREAQRQISDVVEKASLDPDDNALETYIVGTFAWARKKRSHSSFWVYYYYLCSAGVTYRSENQKILQHARARVRRLIVEGMGKGQIRGPLRDLDSLVEKIHAALIGGVLVALTEPVRDSFQTQCARVLETARDLLKSPSHAT